MDIFDLGIVAGFEKTAASIEKLRQGAHRIGFIRAKIKNPTNTAIGMMAGGRIGPRELAVAGGSVATLPSKKAFGKVKDSQTAAFMNALHGAGLSKKQLSKAKEDFGKQIEDSSKRMMRPGKKSHIFAAKGKLTPEKMFSQISGQKLSPEGKKGVNVGALMHEQYERRAGKGPVRYGFGHMNPEVLAKEHNMLAKMTGKGSGEVRKAMIGTREVAGDSSALNKLLKERFGERAGINYGRGQKIPKAMRKRLRNAPDSPTWQRMPGMGG